MKNEFYVVLFIIESGERLMYSQYNDHYKVLGLNRFSEHDDILKSFRGLSMIYHPDKNKDSKESNHFFKIILNSYIILSDPVKKQAYDDFLCKSEYINSTRVAQTLLKSRIGDKQDLLDKISICLWDLDGIIDQILLESNKKKYVLIILTFLDKWILEPGGFPDYFMEARCKEKLDPRIYVHILLQNQFYAHFPYSSIKNYYYDVRKRTDKYISKYEKIGFSCIDEEQNPPLLNRIMEFNNLSIHYLSYLLKDEDLIPEYTFTDQCYVYDSWTMSE